MRMEAIFGRCRSAMTAHETGDCSRVTADGGAACSGGARLNYVAQKRTAAVTHGSRAEDSPRLRWPPSNVGCACTTDCPPGPCGRLPVPARTGGVGPDPATPRGPPAPPHALSQARVLAREGFS